MHHSAAKPKLPRVLPEAPYFVVSRQRHREARRVVRLSASRHEATKRRRSSRVAKTGKPETANEGRPKHSLKPDNKSVNVSGHSNGDLLFQFDGARGPETGVSLGSMSVGQQWQVMVKLRKLTQGEEAELSYQLWQEWPAVDASDADSDSVSTSEQHATNASANASEDGAHQAATQSTLGSSMNDSTAASSKAGSSNSSQAAAQQGEDFVMHAFAQALLSTSGRPAENDEQVTPGTNGYSAASSRQWYSPHIELVSADGEQASPHQSQQNSIDDDRGARRHDAHKYASHRTSSAAHSQDDFTSPPVDFPWPRTLTPKERSVPCYMWHAAGPPTHVSLTHSKPQATADGNEAEFHSDDSAAPDTSTAEYDTFPTRSQLLNIPDDGAQGGLLGLLRPVLHLALQLWRRLPYWFRRLLQFGRKPRGPLLHASPILSQHIRTGRRTEVPGSSFNPATGRSVTPLADLQRHHIENLIGHGVRDMKLYRAALSAPSAVEPDHMIAQSFDRLEYLGDAVVQIVFAEYIYHRFPEDDSGSMTHTIATLAANRAHEQYARHLNLGRYLASNLKYMRPGFRIMPDVIADAFEALVGAIYLDKGFKVATEFLIRVAEDVMSVGSTLSSYRNYKLYLITNVNSANMGRISYMTKQNRSNHMWLSKCFLRDKLVGMGVDTAPKQAEAAAAYAGMKHLNITETTANRSFRRPVTIR